MIFQCFFESYHTLFLIEKVILPVFFSNVIDDNLDYLFTFTLLQCRYVYWKFSSRVAPKGFDCITRSLYSWAVSEMQSSIDVLLFRSVCTKERKNLGKLAWLLSEKCSGVGICLFILWSKTRHPWEVTLLCVDFFSFSLKVNKINLSFQNSYWKPFSQRRRRCLNEFPINKKAPY